MFNAGMSVKLHLHSVFKLVAALSENAAVSIKLNDELFAGAKVTIRFDCVVLVVFVVFVLVVFVFVVLVLFVVVLVLLF